MRTCKTCLVEKLDDDFFWHDKSHTRRKGQCKDCERQSTRAAKAAWYERNRELHKEKMRVSGAERRREFRVWLDEIKSKTPCADCGRFDEPDLMDFDHLSDKEFNIGQSGPRLKSERVLSEIQKCEVVCCRCHRIRTRTRRSSE